MKKNNKFCNIKQSKINNKGITLMTLIVTIVLMLILSAVVITNTTGSNGIIQKTIETVEKAKQSQKIEELELVAMEYSTEKKSTQAIATVDFVQPFLFNDYSESQIRDYVKTLKRAGYNEIILQYVMNISGGKNNNIKIVDAWYDSNLIEDESKLNSYRPNVLNSLVEAINDNNMKIYIGLASSEDWWSNDFENENWRNNNATFYNNMIDEIYKKYGTLDCFAGWYWTFEIYANNKNYYNYWSEMLNSNISYINSIDVNAQDHSFMISPFVSTINDINENEILDFWHNLLGEVNFRNKDIICMQDGLGTSEFNALKIMNHISSTKSAIENDNRNLQFWLNVETYISDDNNNFTSAPLQRYELQLQICACFAKKLASFSYSHYYNPNVVDDANLDNEYRQYYKATTGETKYTIDVPKNGSVYKDKNGIEVPVPCNFSVSNTENCVANGLVILDSFGNEYVWIPASDGIKEKGYIYSNNEYNSVYYTRYLKNGVDINNVTNDDLPLGISSDKTQIKKYGGFYIGRYESSYNYNSGVHAAQIKYNSASKASTSFAWQYANSNIYTGYLLNSINYIDAKTLAENMSSVYSYTGVKTGLVNGTQWDTMLKWFHSNDPTYSKIYNGTTWGNYTDSVSPATQGNYVSLEVKPSGSNLNWKFLNIYDVAGNLAEWTSELFSGTPVLRSNGYNDNGQYGSPSYGWSAASYQYPNVGFRVVLYIE